MTWDFTFMKQLSPEAYKSKLDPSVACRVSSHSDWITSLRNSSIRGRVCTEATSWHTLPCGVIYQVTR